MNFQRLSNAKEPCFGKLYGSFFENTYTVLGLQVDIENGINLVYSYPAEVDFCGVFQVSNGTNDHKRILASLHDVDVTDNPLFISCELDSENKITVNIVINEHVEKANYVTVSEQDIYSQFVHIRLRGNVNICHFINYLYKYILRISHLPGEVPLKCEVSAKSVEETFEQIRKTMSSGAIIFKIAKTNVILFGSEAENSIVGASGQPTVVDMCEESNETVEGIPRKKKTQSFNLDILDVSILRRVTKDAQNVVTQEHAPLCILEKSMFFLLMYFINLRSINI